jgi:polysaccharide export outer membrane protein
VFFPIVWGHPELTQPVTGGSSSDPAALGRLVSADGTAFYPFVGTFKAAGMTAGELRTYLTNHLKSVVQDPQVDVRVVGYRAHRIEVTGEVMKPTTLTLDDTPKGILQAIDACGGLTPAASRRRALLVRGTKIIEINLASLISGDHPTINPAIEPGDVLHIPDQSGDQVFMLGAVNKEQPIIIQQNALSLIQALNTAGGLDHLRANQSGILVFRARREQSGIRSTVYVLDLSTPEAMLLAGQFMLEPRDVVYVKATQFAKYNAVIGELLPTVQEIFYLFEIQNISKNF